jgi:uncharacterized protein YbaR (Trm112 family)
MSLDPLLLNMLACPIDKQALLYLAEDGILYNPRLRRGYLVRDGIPVMLADQGEAATDEQHRNRLRRAAAGAAVATLQVSVCDVLSGHIADLRFAEDADRTAKASPGEDAALAAHSSPIDLRRSGAVEDSMTLPSEQAPPLAQTPPGNPAWRRRIPPVTRPLQGSSRRLRPVLAGLGAFLVVFGLLLRFYAAPRLIAAPADFYAVISLADPHASYFDQGTLTTIRNATLTFTNTIRGDPAAGTGTVAIWDSYTVLEDPKRKIQLQATFQRSAFDRRTGELTNCCGASVNDDTQVRQDGIGVVFWPIGTRETTHQVYDTNTERAWPAHYSGTAVVQGLSTYVFTQRIPATVVQQLPGVPTSLLGLPGPARNVVADRTFQADNTFWVDPRTGVPVDAEEQILSVLHGPNGQGQLMAASADLKMTPASQRWLANLSRHTATSIDTVRRAGPLGGIAVGLLLLLAGTVPARLRHPARRRATRPPDVRTPSAD